MGTRSRMPVLPHRSINYHGLLKQRLIIIPSLHIPKLDTSPWSSRSSILCSEHFSELNPSSIPVHRLQALPLRLPPAHCKLALKSLKDECLPKILPVKLPLSAEDAGETEVFKLCTAGLARHRSAVPSLRRPVLHKHCSKKVGSLMWNFQVCSNYDYS
jgi:hypothetical protein